MHARPHGLSGHIQSLAAGAPAFAPAPWSAGGWRQTALALRNQRAGATDAPRQLEFEVAPGVHVRGHWHPGAGTRAVVLLHGLCGDADSGYLVETARALLESGFGVLRLNARGAGGTLALSRSTYHAAQSGDPVRVVEQLAQRVGLSRVHLLGFSLGGSVALRALLRETVPACIVSAVAVSPPLDLAAAAARLESGPLERLAGRLFLRHLRALVTARLQLDPSAWERCRGTPRGLARLRTVRELDEQFTAPLAGYASAADYYRDASPDLSRGTLPVPALLLQAEDDPLVDAASARALRSRGHEGLGVHLLPHGGHLGFVDRLWPGPRPSWLSRCLVGWIEALEVRHTALAQGAHVAENLPHT